MMTNARFFMKKY